MVVTKNITLRTQGNCGIIDITPQVGKHVAEAGILNLPQV